MKGLLKCIIVSAATVVLAGCVIDDAAVSNTTVVRPAHRNWKKAGRKTHRKGCRKVIKQRYCRHNRNGQRVCKVERHERYVC